MAVDTSIIGRPTGKATVVLERGPVSNFAKAVKDENPVYQDPQAAKAAGFDAIPAPPTFSFAWSHWGQLPEIQPTDGKVEGNPLMEIIGGLMKQGGLILHGEQEFEYHSQVGVGDTLTSEGKITDAYEKDTSSALMTFVVMETVWTNDRTGEKAVTTRFNLIHRAAKKG